MTSPSLRVRSVLALSLALCASWSLAEPRRRPGAPPPPPPPAQFAPPPPVFAPPPVGQPAPAPTGACTALLVVRQTQHASGCSIDERVTRAPGVLHYPCAGGPATATFAGSVFAGSVQAGVVNISLRTGFHFTDGCDWQSVQGIVGDLASGRLTFVYNEAPMPGQSRCANACEARGDVTVQQ